MGTAEEDFPSKMFDAFQRFNSSQTYKDKGLGSSPVMAAWYDFVVAAYRSNWHWQKMIDGYLNDAGWNAEMAEKLADEFQQHLLLLNRYDGAWTDMGYPD